MRRTLVLAGLGILLQAAVAHAGAVLHLGTPPNSGTYLYNGEVRPIDQTNLGILENGNGNPALVDPFLLIIGVVNVDGTFVAPSVDVSAGTATLGGANYYSGTWDTSTGYAGSFTSSFQGDIYSFLGLVPDGNNSNNFGNWAAAELEANGITATGFGIFVYELSGTGISGGVTIDVTFDPSLPIGTFAVAYGQDSTGKAFGTPFTESGLTVPEPGALLLIGTGLLGVGLMRRKLKAS